MSRFTQRVRNNNFDVYALRPGQKAQKNGEPVTIKEVFLENGVPTIAFTYDDTGEGDVTFPGCNLFVEPGR